MIKILPNVSKAKFISNNHVLNKFLKDAQEAIPDRHLDSASSYARSHCAVGFYFPNYEGVKGFPNPAASYAQSHRSVGYLPDFK